MHRLPKALIIFGLLGLLSIMTGIGYAKSWRNLKPILASRITWEKGFVGIVDEDKTRLYHLTGQGSIGIMPLLCKGPNEAELTARQRYIGQWLAQHPQAMAVPVEAWPYFSKTVARIYVWIVDGPETLNLDMVREGLLNGDNLMTTLQFEDLYITSKQLWAFRKQVAGAQLEAARANKGIWADPDYKRANPPDKLFYPGMEPLARLEHAAENIPDPPPVYGANTNEGDLVRIADGDDNAASYAALTELIRRAESGSLTKSAFNTIIANGLSRQADPQRAWRGLYGTLIELAFQQGLLSEAQIERYARQAIVPQIKTFIFKDPPNPQLAIGGEDRVGQVRARSVLKENKAGKLLLVVAYRVRDLRIDDVPVRDFDMPDGVFDSWSRQMRGGTSEKQYRLNPGQKLAPGLHTLSGQVEIRILKGIEAWNTAGRARATPDSIKPLATLQLEIDSLFNIMK